MITERNICFVKKETIYLINWNNFIDYEPKWVSGRNNMNKYIKIFL